jgi:ADP-ribose pyrophosphatase
MSEPELLLETRLFRVVQQTHRTDDGREHLYQIVRHPGAVTILPVLDDGRICLIENYRPAVGQTLLELPAGTREPDEDPATTARRELIEETGYRAGRIELVARFFMSPGILSEEMHLFLATGLVPGEQDLQGGEQITVRVTPWDEVLRMIREGQIRDAKTLVGLLHYATFSHKSEPRP